jgi:hypothetical protein
MLEDRSKFMYRFIKATGALLLLQMASASFSDSLELADGTILEGKFAGSSNGIIMFNTGDSVEAYMENQVVGIYLSNGVKTAQNLSNQPPAPAKSIPAGTKLVIRMAETVDTKKHGAGHKFRGQLEGALVSNGVTIAPRGAFLYGTVKSSKSGGRATGSSEMMLEFTDIMIDDQIFPIATESLVARGQNETKKSAGRTARFAAVGGLYGGSSSAKKGAKLGVGSSLLTSGSSINIPAGTLLDTTLRMALTID